MDGVRVSVEGVQGGGEAPTPEHVAAILGAVAAMLSSARAEAERAASRDQNVGRWVVDGRARARGLHDPMPRTARWGEQSGRPEGRGWEGR